MFEKAEYAQAFSNDGVVRKLEVFRLGPGAATAVEKDKDFVLLEDLWDHFDLSAVRFEREDGVVLAFTRDASLRRHVPERIPACRGSTIYIVPKGMTPPGRLVIAPSPPPRPHRRASSLSSARDNRPFADGTLLPVGVAPDMQYANARILRPVIEDLAIADNPSRQSSQARSLVVSIPEPQGPHGETPQCLIRTVQDTRADEGKTEFDSRNGFDKELAEQAQEIAAGIRQEVEVAVIDVIERSKETLIRFTLVLAKAKEILSASYDFEQGNGPRLFLILPDLHHKWDGSNVLENRFRLFFLCECGAHTTTTPGKNNNANIPQLHLADHEGYVVHQPAKFAEQYGPYLLVMLEMLKFREQIAGYVLPGLSGARVPFTVNTMMPTSLTLDGINKAIAFLERVTGLDTSRPWELAEYLKNVAASDGINLDSRMSSYLKTGKNKSLYANMCRMKSLPGRADWVCRQHHPSKFKHAEYQELESAISSVGARLNHQPSKIAVTLTSSLHADRLSEAIFQTSGMGSYCLELVMGWSYSPEDLVKLERLAELSNIESVTVTAPSSAALSPLSPTLHPASWYPPPQPESLSPRDSHSDYSSSHGRSNSVSSDQFSSDYTSTKLPDWACTYDQPSLIGQQYDDGRTRHSVESAPYMLPNDLTESERLDAQHYIVRYCFKGNYNVRLDRGAELRILDVATGTGVWALEMAQEFPLAEVHGIDLSPIYPTPGEGSNPIPPNCHFQLCNLLEGLPFPDNYFDFVYQRLLVYALTPAQRKQANKELLRVLKPLGHVQLVESDGLIYNAGERSDMVNTLSLETPKLRSVDPNEIQHLKPGLRRAGFIHVKSFNIALPIGDWGGPLGQLSQENMHGLATIWLKGELGRQTQEECDATLVEVDKECERLQSFYKVWLVVGQKPLLKTISHPPPAVALPASPPF